MAANDRTDVARPSPGGLGRTPRGKAGMVGDPYLHLGLLALVGCVLLMVTEFAATSIWLPRHAGLQADQPLPQAVSGIALLGQTDPGLPMTLSEAIRAAALQRKMLAAAVTEAAGERGDATLAAGSPGAAEGTERGTEPASLASSEKADLPAEGQPPQPPMAVWRQAALWTAGMIVVQPSTLKEDDGPRYPLREEYEWLERCRLPSGALSMAPGDRRINPYFANAAAMALLHWNSDAVRDWIVWYLTHMNEVDRFGLRGTVYDHQWGASGVENSMDDYDSADSYAATFLTLVARYFFTTGDAGLVLQHLEKLETVAGVCLALQDEDGLTWANADRRFKFLMDNSEVYRGLADWAEVLRTLGLWQQGDVWAAVAESVRLAVDRELWVESRGAYTWAKTPFGQRAIRRRWYPDTAAQLYPILHGLIDPDGPRAKSLIAMVNSSYPGWPWLATGDQFPWAVIAYVNAVAGDRDMSLRFVDSVWESHLSSGRPWPWYNMEAAYLVFTVLELTDAGSAVPPRR
ncbi:MAG: hypothetical protein Q8P31_11920 [Bacillota bacterium]|nr:hypothetical protein [Bacillota bacterium]